MTEDFSQPNVPEYTVSEVSAALKRTVEDAFGYVRLRGEISKPTVAASGHCYLRLKDEKALIDAVIWRGTMSKLPHKPEEGMDVIASGRITTYAGRSTYQIIIEDLELAGEGALLKLLEDRRKKLLAEGLFDEDRKKALPTLPDVIAVITSPTGAVIRDILHRVKDRFPRRVLLWPVSVQGEGAAEEIAAAIQGLNALEDSGSIPKPDVIIVARGGGSLEDLWAFNEEVLVRAAAESDIPLIAAIGHETDTTLIDFAADRRAPTPTAAAEMAMPVRLDLVSQVQERKARLGRAMSRLMNESALNLQGLGRGLPNLTQLVELKQQDLDGSIQRLVTGPERLLVSKRQELSMATSNLKLSYFSQEMNRYARSIADWGDRLTRVHCGSFDRLAERVQGLVLRLESVSPTRVLERGYALITAEDGTPVTAAANTVLGSAWAVNFYDGTVDVTVDKGGKRRTAPTKQFRKKSVRSTEDDGQGSLL